MTPGPRDRHTQGKRGAAGGPIVGTPATCGYTDHCFFTTAAGTVGDQRAKLAALDAKDPNFLQKANHLAGPDLGAATSTQCRD